MAAASKYLYVGMIILAASGAAAIYLNFQGVQCLTNLAQIDRSVVPPELLEEMERNCAVVTNSYVYSIYAVAAGIVLVVVGFMKKRKDNAS
ncbi:MAG TPA: hypothetical protein VFS46_08585 [Nitrososphaera sp.]|nr:hypothetical protein [Nitrososphaera sp.]